jgi:hypothetical protein
MDDTHDDAVFDFNKACQSTKLFWGSFGLRRCKNFKAWLVISAKSFPASEGSFARKKSNMHA